METEIQIKDGQVAVKHQLFRINRNVNELYKLVNSNVLYYQFNYWVSLFAEFVVYLSVIAILALVIVLPADIRFFFPVDKDLRFIIGLDYATYSNMILLIKILCLVLCLPLLGFAFCLRRGRATKKIIYKAFGEVTKIRNEFEELARVLNSRE